MPGVIKRSELAEKSKEGTAPKPKTQAADDAADKLKAFIAFGVIVVIVVGGILWMVMGGGGSNTTASPAGANSQTKQGTEKGGGEGLSGLAKKKSPAGADDL